MSKADVERGRKLVAWGITGSGDRLVETVDAMKEIKGIYADRTDIRVYLSRAGDQVTKHYRLREDLAKEFRVMVEVDSNTPFLSGQLQLGRFEFLLIAPATSNTVAKISMGIADSLLSNSAVMALKGFTPVYIMPSDIREGVVVTRRPEGGDLRLRVRREDAEHVQRLAKMEDVFVLEKPEEIPQIFERHFG